MTFLAPAFLAGALAVAVPLILHLLKREPETRVKFAAVKLLKHAPVEHTQKHRLRELLLLALRVTALLLLAIAFARPFFSSGAAMAAGGVTIIALDTSYSLSAPGRFARAKQLAKDAIARAPIANTVGVLTFADEAEIVSRPGDDRVLAAAAIDRATAGYGATRYRAALSAAVQGLAGRRGTIVVVTDLQETGWDAGDRVSMPESASIEIVDVGAPPPNLAVTSIQTSGDRVVATIHNAGPRPRDVRVRLAVDDRAAGETMVTLAPNQSADAVFAGARGTAAKVSLDDPDGIQADNARYAVLAGSKPPEVLVVTGSGDAARDAFYVNHALAAAGGGSRGYQVAGLSGAQLSSLDAAAVSKYPAVLLLSTRGLERKGREALAGYVRGGGGLMIAASPDVDGDVIADVLGDGNALKISPVAASKASPSSIAPVDIRHPIFQPFAANPAALGLASFQTVARVSGTGCQPLARFTTGDAALLECAAGEGRALILASDLGNRWNDFPLRATFVPFLHEAVKYLAASRSSGTDYLVADAPPGVARVPGIATIDSKQPGGQPRRVAVNVDPRESDPGRISVEEFQSAVTRLKDVGASDARVEARQAEDRQHLWQYALALMVLTLAMEGFLAGRTA
jgi:hypothetical protein